MTRVEALVGEIEKLTEEEKAELRQLLDARPEPPKRGKYTCDDIHRRLFPNGPPPYRTDEELKKELEYAIIEDDERVRTEFCS